MDVRMPTMDGVEATMVIHQRLPDTQIIMLTTYDDDQYIQDALQAGAVGYLLKDITPKELITAVTAVSGGAFLISPAIAKRLVLQACEQHREQDGRRAREAVTPTWLDRLSRREREVLYFVSHAMTNRQIASALFIAEQTVKNHVSTIYAKIGENNRFRVIEKIKECLDRGYLSPPPES
jgi:DNA-binding NarL/FixJ family response regulator